MDDVELLRLERVARTADTADLAELSTGVIALVEVVKSQRRIIVLMGQASATDLQEDRIATQQRMIEELERRISERGA